MVNGRSGVPDDVALADAIAHGDQSALRSLIDRESARLVRQCARVLGDADDAQDVVQETFMVAYRSIGAYRGEGALGAWLSRIALRLAFRRRRNQARLVPIGEYGPFVPGGDPSTAVAGLLASEAIRAAVKLLPEAHRDVVILHYFGELTLDEIAAATGRPPGTVRSNLHRALKRLRADLQREPAA